MITQNARQLWLQKNGFNPENENTYVVIGETYPIREYLKQHGYTFNKHLMWHGPHFIPLKQFGEFTTLQLNFKDIGIWREDFKQGFITEDGIRIIQQKVYEINLFKDSKPIGTVGERISDIRVSLDSSRCFEGRYGTTYLYRFNHEGNLLLWFTAHSVNLPKRDIFYLSATVKSHEMYEGVHTTYINRCTIKEIDTNEEIVSCD